MPTLITKGYYLADILKNMRITHDLGASCAFGWIKAAVSTQNTLKTTPDAEIMDEIRTIIAAYKEADKQYGKELEARL